MYDAAFLLFFDMRATVMRTKNEPTALSQRAPYESSSKSVAKNRNEEIIPNIMKNID